MSESTSVDYNYPFAHHSTHFQILKSIQTLYRSTVESTLNLIDLQTFLKATQIINNSDTLYVFSSSSNFPTAVFFKEQMASIKKKVEIVTNSTNIKLYYYTMTNKDAAILITYLNRSNYDNLMQLLNDKGITKMQLENIIKNFRK